MTVENIMVGFDKVNFDNVKKIFEHSEPFSKHKKV